MKTVLPCKIVTDTNQICVPVNTSTGDKTLARVRVVDSADQHCFPVYTSDGKKTLVKFIPNVIIFTVNSVDLNYYWYPEMDSDSSDETIYAQDVLDFRSLSLKYSLYASTICPYYAPGSETYGGILQNIPVGETPDSIFNMYEEHRDTISLTTLQQRFELLITHIKTIEGDSYKPDIIVLQRFFWLGFSFISYDLFNLFNEWVQETYICDVDTYLDGSESTAWINIINYHLNNKIY